MAACHSRSPRPFLEAAAEKRAPQTTRLRPLMSGPSDAESAWLGPGRAREPAPASRRDRQSPEGDPRADWLERSEEHTSELQSQSNLVCRLLLEKKKKRGRTRTRAMTRQQNQNED